MVTIVARIRSMVFMLSDNSNHAGCDAMSGEDRVSITAKTEAVAGDKEVGLVDQEGEPTSGNTQLSEVGLDRDMDANYCFADIYVRNAPCYLKGFTGEPDGSVQAELRDSNKGLLAFEKGVCEITASSSFLTVAMSASDDAGLDQIRDYFEQTLRKMSDENAIEFDWRKQ